jgi:hypothetical protein
MKKRNLILAATLALCSGAALAEGDANTPYDPRWAAQEQQREAWAAQRQADIQNPGLAEERGAMTPSSAYRFDRQGYAPGVECWNTEAKHYEDLRPGPRQGDLDHTRCRYKEGYRPSRGR